MMSTKTVLRQPRTSPRRRAGRVGMSLLLAFALMGSVGCGHSEDEWKRQLARYADLGQQYQDQQTELEKARAEVERLKGELQSLGVNLQSEQTKAGDLQKLLDEAKAQAALLERVKARFEALRKKLQGLTEFGLQVKIRHNKMVISLPGDVLFPSGSAKLSKTGEDVVAKVAKVLLSDNTLSERYYQVAGHTDNQPVVRTVEEFKDNWGLSLMRAREVLLYLTKVQAGRSLPINHWSAAGYADTDPVADNTTPDSRRQNRRVELVVQPDVEEMLDLKSLIEKTAKSSG